MITSQIQISCEVGRKSWSLSLQKGVHTHTHKLDYSRIYILHKKKNFKNFILSFFFLMEGLF